MGVLTPPTGKISTWLTGQHGWFCSTPATITLAGERLVVVALLTVAVPWIRRSPDRRLGPWRLTARRMGAVTTERDYERNVSVNTCPAVARTSITPAIQPRLPTDR